MLWTLDSCFLDIVLSRAVCVFQIDNLLDFTPQLGNNVVEYCNYVRSGCCGASSQIPWVLNIIVAKWSKLYKQNIGALAMFNVSNQCFNTHTLGESVVNVCSLRRTLISWRSSRDACAEEACHCVVESSSRKVLWALEIIGQTTMYNNCRCCCVTIALQRCSLLYLSSPCRAFILC